MLLHITKKRGLIKNMKVTSIDKILDKRIKTRKRIFSSKEINQRINLKRKSEN
jgi:hypothetical protein